jgi:hypothetical protein
VSAPAAFAAVPSAANSTVPTCIVACPNGDIPVSITVRDFANNPIAFSNVVLDFTNCPGTLLCPAGAAFYTLAPPQVSKLTDANGVVVFPLQASGGCAEGVNVRADGVTLASGLAFASPDQNASGVVDGADATIFNAKMLTYDGTADFTCDGFVDSTDQAIFAAHAGHACGVVVPTRPSTWGRVKQIYR